MENYVNLRSQMWEKFKLFKLPRIKRPTPTEELEKSLRDLRTPDRNLRDAISYALFGMAIQNERNRLNHKEPKDRPKVNWQKEGF